MILNSAVSTMSTGTMLFIITIAGSVIMLLVLMVAYFIKREFNKQDATNDKLEKAINKLSGSITGFNAIAIKWEERHFNLKDKYEDHIRQLHKTEVE